MRDSFGDGWVSECDVAFSNHPVSCFIATALFLSCLHAMAGHGYAYAIIGGVGPTAFYADTVGAVPIEGSSPEIYRDLLRKKEANMPAGGDA